MISYTLDAFEQQLLLTVIRRGNECDVMRRRVEAIQKQIRNCTDAIADGKRHPSLMEKLSELEQELADTKAKFASREPRAVRLRLKDARRFAEARHKEMQLVLNREPRIARRRLGSTFKKSR